MARKRPTGPSSHSAASQEPAETTLRIIGGDFRGRKLRYSGDPRTRPMKDRVREALFNLLGPSVRGCHALDLFAGTGALGLEALSRGAARATFCEKHFPTAQLIEENIAGLGLGQRARVVPGSTFVRLRSREAVDELAAGPEPWVAFVSPPFDFFVDRADDMLKMISHLIEAARPGCVIVVESDQRFDFAQFTGDWDVREYPPARVGILRIE